MTSDRSKTANIKYVDELGSISFVSTSKTIGPNTFYASPVGLKRWLLTVVHCFKFRSHNKPRESILIGRKLTKLGELADIYFCCSFETVHDV
jgi:hypothetical protein